MAKEPAKMPIGKVMATATTRTITRGVGGTAVIAVEPTKIINSANSANAEIAITNVNSVTLAPAGALFSR